MGTGYLVELCEYRGRGKQLSRGGWARLAERRHCLRYHPDNKVFLPANKARATAQCHEVETAHVRAPPQPPLARDQAGVDGAPASCDGQEEEQEEEARPRRRQQWPHNNDEAHSLTTTNRSDTTSRGGGTLAGDGRRAPARPSDRGRRRGRKRVIRVRRRRRKGVQGQGRMNARAMSALCSAVAIVPSATRDSRQPGNFDTRRQRDAGARRTGDGRACILQTTERRAL